MTAPTGKPNGRPRGSGRYPCTIPAQRVSEEQFAAWVAAGKTPAVRAFLDAVSRTLDAQARRAKRRFAADDAPAPPDL